MQMLLTFGIFFSLDLFMRIMFLQIKFCSIPCNEIPEFDGDDEADKGSP
jgi:hypothetical protein